MINFIFTVSDPRFSLMAIFFILASICLLDTSFSNQFDLASVIRLGIESPDFSLITYKQSWLEFEFVLKVLY